MSFAALKKIAQRLQDQAGFLVEISDDKEYEKALALMDELIDDDDNQPVLIELLSKSIEQWESTSDEFAEFNQCIDQSSGFDAAIADGPTWLRGGRTSRDWN